MVMVREAKASANRAGERMQGDLELELDWCYDEVCPGTPRLRAELANGTLGVVVASVLKMGGHHM